MQNTFFSRNNNSINSAHAETDMLLTSPLSVPVTENPEMESPSQSQEVCEKISNLPKGIRYKLFYPDTPEKIQKIGRKYSFELLKLANITRLIREYYFGEVKLEDFSKEIEKRMGVSLSTAQEIAKYIQREIVDWDPWGEYIAKLPKITVREIVDRYPKLAETEITGGYIESRNSTDLLDPTLKNWIQDYVAHLGYTRHTQMQRSEYLFRSENGANLSSPDREKLGIILKSFDENIPLPVDKENGEIVFDSVITDPAGKALPVAKTAVGMSDWHSDASRQKSAINNIKPTVAPKPKPESFIRPYPKTETNFAPPATDHPSVSFASLNHLQPVPEAKKIVGPEFGKQSQTSLPPPPDSLRDSRRASLRPAPVPTQSAPNPEIDKFFAVTESPGISPIKVHSITAHNEPRSTTPRKTVAKRKTLPKTKVLQAPQPKPIEPKKIVQPTPPKAPSRPKYRIISPFSKSMPEPKINGNVVDLRNN